MKKILSLFLVALMAITMFACGEKSPEEQIVGTWKLQPTESTFFDDGESYFYELNIYNDGTYTYAGAYIVLSSTWNALFSNLVPDEEFTANECLYSVTKDEYPEDGGTYSIIHDGSSLEMKEGWNTNVYSLEINGKTMTLSYDGITLKYKKQ